MNSKGSSLLCFAIFLLFTSANAAVDITKILSQSPDLSQFSKLLTETKVADEINSRQTITVLALNNGAMSSLAGKPQDVLKKILSVHVVLDYFDVQKLTKLSLTNKTGPTLTTLFQASGQALDQQGFLTVVLLNEGEVTIGSAVKNAPLRSSIVKSVAAQPFSISVVQISEAIQVPGIEIPNPNAPTGNNKNGNVNAQAPHAVAGGAPKTAPQVAAPAQAPSRKIVAPTPSEGPKTGSKTPAPEAEPTQSPVDSQTPTASTPSGATTPSSTSPSADASPADAQSANSPSPSSAPSQKVAVGFGFFMALVSFVGL